MATYEKSDITHLENQPVEQQPPSISLALVEETGSVMRQKSKQEKLVILKQDVAISFILSGCFFFSYLVSNLFNFLTFPQLTLVRIEAP